MLNYFFINGARVSVIFKTTTPMAILFKKKLYADFRTFVLKIFSLYFPLGILGNAFSECLALHQNKSLVSLFTKFYFKIKQQGIDDVIKLRVLLEQAPSEHIKEFVDAKG